eukprot:TRINITY_DN51353_c0_g1_i1.p1 TRINITY_DN51353_c0_g1~~TRINITY_DN51353_c0_g1_i1.p1  ORF type:complete len:602 (-),score=96.45 TRINITY_DN51353_c0_g1_i1:172-1977(-)
MAWRFSADSLCHAPGAVAPGVPRLSHPLGAAAAGRPRSPTAAADGALPVQPPLPGPRHQSPEGWTSRRQRYAKSEVFADCGRRHYVAQVTADPLNLRAETGALRPASPLQAFGGGATSSSPGRERAGTSPRPTSPSRNSLFFPLAEPSSPSRGGDERLLLPKSASCSVDLFSCAPQDWQPPRVASRSPSPRSSLGAVLGGSPRLSQPLPPRVTRHSCRGLLPPGVKELMQDSSLGDVGSSQHSPRGVAWCDNARAWSAKRRDPLRNSSQGLRTALHGLPAHAAEGAQLGTSCEASLQTPSFSPLRRGVRGHVSERAALHGGSDLLWKALSPERYGGQPLDTPTVVVVTGGAPATSSSSSDCCGGAPPPPPRLSRASEGLPSPRLATDIAQFWQVLDGNSRHGASCLGRVGNCSDGTLHAARVAEALHAAPPKEPLNETVSKEWKEWGHRAKGSYLQTMRHAPAAACLEKVAGGATCSAAPARTLRNRAGDAWGSPPIVSARLAAGLASSRMAGRSCSPVGRWGGVDYKSRQDQLPFGSMSADDSAFLQTYRDQVASVVRNILATQGLAGSRASLPAKTGRSGSDLTKTEMSDASTSASADS